MDHDNLSGSVLVLALLRPHLYMEDALPLRLFGYPVSMPLLAVDGNPHSGGGADNKRTNLLEALCAHWVNLPKITAAETALEALQDAWRVMRAFAHRLCVAAAWACPANQRAQHLNLRFAGASQCLDVRAYTCL